MEANFLLLIQDNLRTSVLDLIMIFIGRLGDAGWIWIAAGVAMLIFRKTRIAGIAVLASLLLGLLTNNVILKNLVCRPRPYDMIQKLTPIINPLRDFSFPSGHTCSAFAASTAITLWLRKKWGFCYILAALIAISRIYVGVHYPTDIIAGAVLGALCAFAVFAIINVIRRKRNERVAENL